MAVGTKVEIQGENEYKKALKDITSSLKLVTSELKLTSTEFANGDKSLKQTKTSYESMNKVVQEQKTKIAELRAKLPELEKEYGANSDKVKMFKTQLNNAETQLKQMEDATDKSSKELKEMKNGFDDAGNGAIKFGDILKANVLGDVIVGGLKALGDAIVDVGKKFIDVGKQAIDGYADFEQLEGGVKKLFGEDMAETVKKNANDAFKTAGMTANEYMETVTGFSASLISSLGGDTAKATEYADTAIRDMSDNANTFGTDISMLQSAYSGFAKGNYTMLDNLKLGYGGTKTEMERLLKDASKISGIKYDISSFADITQAIHVMQEEMSIAGTTSAEASKTISGSISSMKGAWSNLITGLADDSADLGQLMNNVIEGVFGKDGEGGVLNNILPRIEIVIDSIVELLPEIIEKIVEFMPELLETGMDILQQIMDGIITLIPELMPVVINVINSLIGFIIENLPAILETGMTILLSLVQGIVEAIPDLIPAIIKCIETMLSTLISFLPDIIMAGLDLLMALIFGIVDNINEIIDAILYLTGEVIATLLRPDVLTKIISAGIQLVLALIVGLLKAIPDVVLAIPKIIASIVDAFRKMDWNKIGNDIIRGICDGLTSMGDFIWTSIKKVGNSMLGGIKKFFGIESPSKLMKNEVGNFLAEGIGVGFEDTMSDVTEDMTNAIPTEFDTKINANYSANGSVGSSNYDAMLGAFKQALQEVKVVMNDREFGGFVTDTMTKVVYS